MFWRRRKLPEDDEPLVPHGLVWQATETEGSTELPPDMWANSPEDVEQSPAEPVEMRLRVSAPVKPDPQQDQGAANPCQISPPVKWPGLDGEEIARRAQLIDTAVSFPYRQPLVSAAVPKPAESNPEPELEEPPGLELVSVSPFTPIRAARTEKFRKLISRVRSLKLPSLVPIWQRARNAEVLGRMKRQANSSIRATSQQLDALRQSSGPVLGKAKLRLVDNSKAAMSQSRAEMQRIAKNISAFDLSGAARIWNRVSTLKITIRIPASNRRFIHTIAQRTTLSRLRLQQVMQRDSRLWGSLGMGALSALLALGVISELRHYDPNRGPTQPTPQTVQAAAPATAAQRAAPFTPKVVSVKEPIVSKPSPIASSGQEEIASAAKPATADIQGKGAVSPGSPRKHRIRRISDEDDYVAKDTYVFYGKSGKPSR